MSREDALISGVSLAVGTGGGCSKVDDHAVADEGLSEAERGHVLNGDDGGGGMRVTFKVGPSATAVTSSKQERPKVCTSQYVTAS